MQRQRVHETNSWELAHFLTYSETILKKKGQVCMTLEAACCLCASHAGVAIDSNMEKQ